MLVLRSWLIGALLLCATCISAGEFGNWDWQRAPFSPSDFVRRQACIDAFNAHYQPFEDTYAAEMKKIFAEVNRLLDIAGVLGTQLKDAEQQLTAAHDKWEAESPALIKELRKAEAEANRLQKNLDQLYKRLDAIEKLLSGVLKPDRRADLEREKTALKQSIAEMSDRLAAISARINDIKAALERMQREIDKWTNATKTLRKDIAVVEAQLRILSRIQNDMVDKHTKMLNTWARQIAACKDRE